MKTYTNFHGQIPISEIGKALREIINIEKKAFKILTGYGASFGMSHSKQAAIKSLGKMRKEGLIKGFLPGEVKHLVLTESSAFYASKMTYESIIKKDADYGNDGIIFVFIQ